MGKELTDLTDIIKAGREASIAYANKYKTQASSEGLENIADDFMAGVKWAIEQREWKDEPETGNTFAADTLWSCYKCGQKDIPGTHVTYEETHVNCGGNCHWLF